MTEKELIEQIKDTDNVKIVVAKKKKKGGYTIFPQVHEVVHTVVPMVGECYVIVYE